ncbi:MAG TPA: GlsB/YeaQ/YmgE family stress response membrane protein [Blastocatellia bacterium]|nr:GlsB/YeaQ/YmgE family stress response membrane protein [Blastocatellia bacterium]
MLLHSTKLWMAGNKFALFLIQTDRRAGNATEDLSMWGTTYKVRWITLACAILIGFVAGAVAHRVTRREEAVGLITSIILAIVGSVVGTLIGGLIWRNDSRVFSLGGLLLSVLGAVLFLFLLRRVFTPR